MKTSKKNSKKSPRLRFAPFDVAATQVRAAAAIAAFAFLTAALAVRDGRVFQEPEPNRPALSAFETKQKNAPKMLKSAVAALAPSSNVVETSAKIAFVSSPSTETTLGFVVDLNSAKKSELLNLPRIGNALADRILEYREQNDGFQSVDELSEIKGIGAKTLEKLRPFCVARPLDETPSATDR